MGNPSVPKMSPLFKANRGGDVVEYCAKIRIPRGGLKTMPEIGKP